MKDQEFKDIWRSLEDFPGLPISEKFNTEQFKKYRSTSINDEIRKLLKKDLLIKLGYEVIILINIVFYINAPNILYTCIGLLILMSYFSILQYKIIQQFNRISDPGRNASENLSEILIFLQRRLNILGILSGTVAFLGLLPAMLLYFYFEYGGLRPLTGMDFFVFGSISTIGAIMLYSKTTSQIRYYIKHITVCVSDLNENILQFAYSSIEKERKKDNALKLVIGLMSIFAFVVVIAVIKSITS